jgi:hypothetical protein
MAAAGLIMLVITPLLFVISTDKVGTAFAILFTVFGVMMLILGAS